MKNIFHIAIILSSMLLAGCASTSLKQTWKSSTSHAGPVKKIAVIAVAERGLVRQGFENRFVRDFSAQGQEAMVTHNLLDLPEIKANKEAAAARALAAGADTVLIVRLVDKVSYERSTQALYVGATTGFDDSIYSWYDYYTVAYTDMSSVWSSTTQKVYLDCSLYDLNGGGRLWSALTLTTSKEDADRLAEADVLVNVVVKAMRKDGMVR